MADDPGRDGAPLRQGSAAAGPQDGARHRGGSGKEVAALCELRARHDAGRLLAEPAIDRSPSAPPISGASQNSQSCASAQPPTNRAGPVLRAGFTEVLVTGMLTRWIITSASPMASGAKPAGALPWVTPMMMNRNIMVITTSVMKHTTMLYCPGECAS